MKAGLLNSRGILIVNSKTIDFIIILFSSLFIGLLAQFSLSLPLNPIPITGQTIGVVLVGSVLGSKRGVLSILCYLILGAFGVPVFAQMKYGIDVLVGPTAGYLWAFLCSAYIIGVLNEKGYMEKPLSIFISCLISTLVILIIGMIYLSTIKGFSGALLIGFYPFIIGAITKSLISAMIIFTVKNLDSFYK